MRTRENQLWYLTRYLYEWMKLESFEIPSDRVFYIIVSRVNGQWTENIQYRLAVFCRLSTDFVLAFGRQLFRQTNEFRKQDQLLSNVGGFTPLTKQKCVYPSNGWERCCNVLTFGNHFHCTSTVPIHFTLINWFN